MLYLLCYSGAGHPYSSAAALQSLAVAANTSSGSSWHRQNAGALQVIVIEGAFGAATAGRAVGLIAGGFASLQPHRRAFCGGIIGYRFDNPQGWCLLYLLILSCSMNYLVCGALFLELSMTLATVTLWRKKNNSEPIGPPCPAASPPVPITVIRIEILKLISTQENLRARRSASPACPARAAVNCVRNAREISRYCAGSRYRGIEYRANQLFLP
jgi:hypothetical protein